MSLLYIILYSSFCDDYIAVYGGMPYSCCHLVALYCSFDNSESTFDVKLSTRNALIRFLTDGQKGRGRGFRGTFAAQGELNGLHCNLTTA